MNKQIISTLLLCAAIATQNLTLSAHGSCENKSKANGDFRVKAHARVSNVLVPKEHTIKSTSPTADITASKSNGCANQTSRNNAGAHSFSGSVSQRQCARGYGLSNLAEVLYPTYIFHTNDNEILEECEMGSTGISISGNAVTIQGIGGYMRAVEDMVSLYSIKIWLPSNETDSIIEPDESLFDGTIRIINGVVSIEGDFVGKFGASNYKDSLLGEFRKVRFLGSDFTILISLPDGYTMSDIAIRTETDGYHNEDYSRMAITGVTETKIAQGTLEYNVYPNPAKNQWNCIYLNSKSENDFLNIKLFDVHGKLLSENKIHSSKGNKTEFMIGVPSEGNTFFLLISDGGEQYLKQLIKE